MQESLIKSTIDELNQYLNGNVSKRSLITTLLETADELLNQELSKN
jgi:hypothetical protein